MSEKDPLWEQFNLAEDNPDQGGGILYAMRYEPSMIAAHREAIVKALQDLGIQIVGLDDGIGLKNPTLSDEEMRRCMALLEELSVLNEAGEYQAALPSEVKDLEKLVSHLKTAFYALLARRGRLVDTYNLVSMEIPQIVSSLRSAMEQGKVFSKKEIAIIDELAQFAAKKEDALNNPRGVVVIG